MGGGLCGEELSSVWERTDTWGPEGSPTRKVEGHWAWPKAAMSFLPRVTEWDNKTHGTVCGRALHP